MHQRQSPPAGKCQALIDRPSNVARPDADHKPDVDIDRAGWTRGIERADVSEPSGSPAGNKLIGIGGIVNEPDHLHIRAGGVHGLDYVVHLTTEAASPHDHQSGAHRHGRDATAPPTLDPMTPARWLHSPVKRAVDAGVAAAVLVLASPVIAATALAVRVRLGAPVLFRQARAGRDGHPIEIVKFRSMTDARGADGELLPDDQRLPRFGRLLRASSLDELPQLWNVVRGDMSLIGPRPLPLTYVDRYNPDQRRRLDAIPGITGWAQVHGRNALDWPAKLAYDVWYVDHASPRIDLKIIGLTVRAVLTRGGVNAIDHVTMYEFLGDDPSR
jgi:sugar transferase EpsL